MQITKPTKAEVTRELKDYIFITLGLISYALGWAAFLIPYQITTEVLPVSVPSSIMPPDFPSSGHTSSSMPY